jgi:hypothetical protein
MDQDTLRFLLREAVRETGRVRILILSCLWTYAVLKIPDKMGLR